MRVEINKSVFVEELKRSGVFDPEGTHHEFNQGLHGQKANFDAIKTGNDLFWSWIDLVAQEIEQIYRDQPDMLVGVANGTNRIIEPVSRRLDSNPEPLKTMKRERSSPILTAMSRKAIRLAQPSFVLVVEDAGNRGTNSLSVVRSVQELGVERVEVLNTLQRSPELELLRANGISYRSILTHILPTYTPEECEERGFCAQGWRLIPYKT